MSKRSHADFAGPQAWASGSGKSKKHERAVPGALELDALINCALEMLPTIGQLNSLLRTLQHRREQVVETRKSNETLSLEYQLGQASRELAPLLPTLKSLAAIDIERPDAVDGRGAAVLEDGEVGQAEMKQLNDTGFSSTLLAGVQTSPISVVEASSRGMTSNALVPKIGLQIPSISYVPAMALSDIPSSLPPLPAVLDANLEAAAFTHTGIDRAHWPNGMNYERLEWLGDAYIELISSCMLFRTFDGVQEGDLSRHREILVRNNTLREYAFRYGFQHRAKLPRDHRDQKVFGDIFEAYVAAVIISDPSDGLDRAVRWLKALWAGTLERHLRSALGNPSQPPRLGQPGEGSSANMPPPSAKGNPKDQLAAALVVKGVSVAYKARDKMVQDRDHKTKMFVVEAHLEGWGERVFLGSGVGKSKTEAGEAAAKTAMKNKGLMKKYSDKKQAYLTARKAAM